MKRVNIQALVPGMITAEDVYTYGNQLILPKHTVLSDKAITRLEFYSVLSIRILDEVAEDETAGSLAREADTPALPEPSYSELIQASPAFTQFKADYDETVDAFRDQLNDIVQKDAAIDVQEIFADTVKLFNRENNTTYSLLHMLQNMRQYDDLTYAHCMNVALICNLFAGWLRLSPEETQIATMSGLLHDIGKLAIPDQIIKKPDKLTDQEYTIIKKHTIEGYNILKKQNISDHIKNAALMHHERCDGCGYPFRLPENKIDKFAKIVAIADVYDAMTAARSYRAPKCAFQVIAAFESDGFQKYNPKVIFTFLQRVAACYNNSRVLLNDGTAGRVVFLNKNALSRPIIETDEDDMIDLSSSENKELFIKAIL